MLAQNFKSTADLGITEPQRDALAKVLVLLETGKLVHVPRAEIYSRHRCRPSYDQAPAFSGHFNMGWTTVSHDCGTIGCIKGNAELISEVTFPLPSEMPEGLGNLFYGWGDSDPGTAQAARALRSYLSAGEANWADAVKEN